MEYCQQNGISSVIRNLGQENKNKKNSKKKDIVIHHQWPIFWKLTQRYREVLASGLDAFSGDSDHFASVEGCQEGVGVYYLETDQSGLIDGWNNLKRKH